MEEFDYKFGPLGKSAIDYLKSRGVTKATAKEWALRYDEVWDRVVFSNSLA